jgi:hypothetical protein
MVHFLNGTAVRLIICTFFSEAITMAEAAKSKKESSAVEVHFAADGTMLPRIIEWEDGHKYEIDRVLKIQPAPAMKAGGQGDRYTVMIGGQQRYLFFEHSPEYGAEKIGKWFVERRVE